MLRLLSSALLTRMVLAHCPSDAAFNVQADEEALLQILRISPCKVNGTEAVVNIPGLGRVIGKVLASGVSEFISIPYGEQPVRFNPPVAKTQWPAGEIDATGPGVGCFQAGQVPIEQQSEDCLLLNIWAPPGAKRKSLPVWFWMHGGAFNNGAGYLYNASSLSMRAEIVVVTPNYRLGALGFFASTEIVAETEQRTTGGMNGHLDQLLALKWVKEHIGRFGGDPDRVFIGGESSGSDSACVHAHSALTAELGVAGFVYESGSCVGPASPNSQAGGLDASREWVKKLELIQGVDIDANNVLISLRKLPAAAFNGEDLSFPQYQGKIGVSNINSVDGYFLYEHPLHSKLMVAPETAVILGTNDMDGQDPFFEYYLRYNDLPAGQYNETGLIDNIMQFGFSENQSKKIVEFYQREKPSPPVRGWMNFPPLNSSESSNCGYASCQNLWFQIRRDATISCPNRWLAEKHMKEPGGKAFLYWQYFQNSSLTYHGIDIFLIFGPFDLLPNPGTPPMPFWPLTSEEYENAVNRTGLLFRQFFHGLMEESDWENYDSKKGNYMNLTFNPHMSNEYAYSDVLCKFWQEVRDESVALQEIYMNFASGALP